MAYIGGTHNGDEWWHVMELWGGVGVNKTISLEDIICFCQLFRLWEDTSKISKLGYGIGIIHWRYFGTMARHRDN